MTHDSSGKQIRDTRLEYGLTQHQLALKAGISRRQLSFIENEQATPTKDTTNRLLSALDDLNPYAPLFLLFDYVRIRFPTTDVASVIEGILKLKMRYFIHEDYAFYSYLEHYALGDIIVMTSPEEDKGVLLELKGKGCRQFETYLHAQGRSWFDFFMDCLLKKAVIKRVDLAINDKVGILDIPFLTEKCRKEECISVFRSFKSYRSGELIKREEKEGMGNTLYIGSLRSDIYFCLYEKDYEEYKKNGIPFDEATVKNRFEIRLKNDRALYALRDLMQNEDPEHTAFKIINRYIRFVDQVDKKPRGEWPLNQQWAWFIGENRESMKLTTQPEPYSFDRTLRWLERQVAPTWKIATKLDEINQTSHIKDMLHNATLTDKHKQILEQQAASVEDMIL
ncbi:MobT family relaxase [Marinilactibacillus psychrotolerans]|uniref:MobT family relaxase n=1 Tax=Marinilactibacillus psychrotolerans TaxID=191770 RepID=UPI003885A0B1